MVAPSVLRRHRTTHGRSNAGGRGGGQIVLSVLDPAHRYARTIFSTRVYDPSEVARVLKDCHQSRKIGKFVTKGPRRGWPLFTLTLEERATCPRSCRAWALCFGNNMQAAERIVAGPELEQALWSELAELQRQHPAGFMVRLHVLGDFYSRKYVELWAEALDAFPALHVFGFTARLPGTPLGDMLWKLVNTSWDRFAVRFSGLDEPELGSQLIPEHHPQAVQCPAQTDPKDERHCGSCMLCIYSRRSIAFARH